MKKKQINKKFKYYDFDFLSSPDGWLEAKLENRLKEGYFIWRDNNEMCWNGILPNSLIKNIKS